jgi:hypothetical protein
MIVGERINKSLKKIFKQNSKSRIEKCIVTLEQKNVTCFSYFVNLARLL